MYLTIKIAVGVALGVAICALIWMYSPVQVTRNSPASISISYVDVVSIMLTAVSVILGALGFVVAILAFIGWNSIGDKVTTASREFLRESVKEGGDLHALVKKEAKSIIYRGIEPVDTEFEEEADDGEKV